MNYLDDINNVRPIYIDICTQLEMMQYDDKIATFERITVYGNEILENVQFTGNNLDQLRIHLMTRELLRTLMTCYVIKNRILSPHRNAILDMQFNLELFQDEYANYYDNIHCLK